MNLKRIIRTFYLIYTIYILAVVCTTSITFYYILPAILFMWINYFVFSAGYLVNAKRTLLYSTDSDSWLLNRSKKSLFLIAFFSIVFSITAAKYYTGQIPASLFWNLINNVSVYYEYQSYFQEQQRYIFSFSKIPFVFMMFYLKFFLFYSYIVFFMAKENITSFEKVYLAIVTLSYVYFGLARGTNYEFFELVMVIIFIILSKYKQKKLQLPLKALSKVFLLIGIMIVVFYIGVSARGVKFNYYISQDVSYDPNGLLPLISPFVSLVVLIIYNYFGFGFFYIATYIKDLWFSSSSSFIAGFLPLGYQAFVGNKIPTLMSALVDMGARWHPDSVLFIDTIGYFGLLLFCFLMGYFAKYTLYACKLTSIIYLTNFIILLQMISLPVGNFISTSSASQLIVIVLLFYWIWKIFIKVKIKM